MKYTKHIFKNGLNYIKCPLHDTKSVTLLLLFRVGSRYETEEQAGIAHFLEHMMFKGTEKRPTSLAITKELDAIGAEYNAFTAKDYTGYYIKTTSEHFELGIDILSDMTLCSIFDSEEVEREKKVVFEEIKMYHENPIMYIEEYFESLLYGKSALGREIAGSEHLLSRLTRQDLIAFHKIYYTLSNAYFVVAGDLRKNVNKIVSRYFFDKIQTRRICKRSFMPYQHVVSQQAPLFQADQRAGDQVQLGMGFPTFGYQNKSLPALRLLSIILGGNMSSRLFCEIREKRGIAYIISCSVNTYADTGNLFIHAGLDSKRVHEAILAVGEQLAFLKLNGVTEEELHRAKEYIKGKMALHLEDSEEVAQWLGRKELSSKKYRTPDEEIKALERVSAREIHNLADAIFNKDSLHIAALGKFDHGEEMLKEITF